nr:DExH-box ATP-dependent RNA helicase DExH1 isoform X1 [Ipomoea batatas]
MSLRLLFYCPTSFQFRLYKPLSVARSSCDYNLCTRRVPTLAMSNRPNYQGGEQRWWDPAWRAERLRQKAAEMEVMNENEWWGKIEQFKRGGEQEMIIKRNFSRDDQGKLSDMAYQLGLHL